MCLDTRMSHLHVSVHFIHIASTLNEPVQVLFIMAGCSDRERFITKALESVLNDFSDGTLHLQLLCSALVYDIVNKSFINPVSFRISSIGRNTISWIRQEELLLTTG
jgi:hypothetical protein